MFDGKCQLFLVWKLPIQVANCYHNTNLVSWSMQFCLQLQMSITVLHCLLQMFGVDMLKNTSNKAAKNPSLQFLQKCQCCLADWFRQCSLPIGWLCSEFVANAQWLHFIFPLRDSCFPLICFSSLHLECVFTCMFEALLSFKLFPLVDCWLHGAHLTWAPCWCINGIGAFSHCQDVWFV